MSDLTIVEAPQEVAPSILAETPPTDNDVAIAEIEASRDVVIAEVNADARVAEAEAYNNSHASIEEIEQWRTDISHLQNELAEIKGTLEGLVQSLISSPPVVEVVEIPPEVVEEIVAEAETISTPISTLEETSSTQTEVIEESGAESLIPPIVEIDRKPIIKLV